MKGGFHPESRTLGVLAEIQVEAHCGRRSISRRERDLSFEEIVRLSTSATQLLGQWIAASGPASV